MTISQALLRYAVGGPLLSILCLSLGDHGNALGRAFLHGLQDASVWILLIVMLPPMLGSIGAIIARHKRLRVRLAWSIAITIAIMIIIRSGSAQGFGIDALIVAGLAGLVSAAGWIIDAAATKWKESRRRPALFMAAALLTITGLTWIVTGAIDTYQKGPAPAHI